MSAELLREAASKMRERAEGATDRLTDDWWSEHALTWLQRTSGTHDLAEHMASWHPAVALAVADWLDSTSSFVDMYGVTGSETRGYSVRRALAVARAYLGEAS